MKRGDLVEEKPGFKKASDEERINRIKDGICDIQNKANHMKFVLSRDEDPVPKVSGGKSAGKHNVLRNHVGKAMTEICQNCHEDVSYPTSKNLPCTHTVCMTCIKGVAQPNDREECPMCCTQKGASDFPSTEMKGAYSSFCDACMEEGVNNQTAQMYCSNCKEKYCERHLAVHNIFRPTHITIDIESYSKQKEKEKVAYCTGHQGQVCTLGCKICLNVFCVDCVFSASVCIDGEKHDLKSIDQLVNELDSIMEPSRTQATEMEQVLSNRVTEWVIASSTWDKGSQAIKSNLRRVRDEELEAIRQRYIKLEEELVGARDKVKLELEESLDVVDQTLCSLQRNISKLSTRQKDQHNISIITQCKEARRDIQSIAGKLSPE